MSATAGEVLVGVVITVIIVIIVLVITWDETMSSQT